MNKTFKPRRALSLIACALLVSATSSLASPTGGVVTSGSANISQSGKITNVEQSTNKATINWQNFSIGSDETVNFKQPNANSITLNRVIGNEKSVIDGALNANGQVWILNSNGVLFGKNASINTSGLLATTGELSDNDFNAGNYNFTNSSSNSVLNLGTIEISNEGYVALVGKEVENQGSIKAIKGKVELVGADEYSINLNGNSLLNLTVKKGVLDAIVKNSGSIMADGGEIYLTTNAVDELLEGIVNNTGIIKADSIDGLTGKVELYAHGGEVQIGGTITAEGKGNNDGGFIETSGDTFSMLDGYNISTKAENGNTGTWLLDPSTISIEDGGVDDISGQYIDADTVIAALANNNVILQADFAIYIREALNILNNTLTLRSGSYLYVDPSANVNVSGNAGLKVEVAQSKTREGWVVYAHDEITPGGFIRNSDADSMAGALTVAPTASYTYKFASDGAETELTGVFNNGVFRIGNGWYNSVAQNGMLEQPWYYDNTGERDGWYRLTYETYNLDQAVGLGGDGTSAWNLNGEISNTDNSDYSTTNVTGADVHEFLNLNATITGTSINTSDFDNSTGTGTIKVATSFTSFLYGGEMILINSYTLNEEGSYLKTDTTLWNNTGSSVTNARFWVGTRDDYVALSDNNFKTKGNLTSNGFEAISNQTDEANALVISEYSLDGDSGSAVLFYSTSDNTNTVFNECCSFTNAIVTNPTESEMNTEYATDGAYGLFTNFGDIAHGSSKSVTWYYAATPLSQLSSTLNQVTGTSTPTSSNTNLEPVITPITNTNLTDIEKPEFQLPKFDRNSKVTFEPMDGETSKMVSIDEIKSTQIVDSQSNDTVVPLSNNSVIDLINGGLHLPKGVNQQFFVLDNEKI